MENNDSDRECSRAKESHDINPNHEREFIQKILDENHRS